MDNLSIIVILTPFLIYDDEYQDHHHLGIDNLDKLIDWRISEDYTKVKDIFLEDIKMKNQTSWIPIFLIY